MRPIPKKLLIHTATLHKIADEDRWGNGGLDEGTVLRYIRVEPTSRIVRDKNNAEIQLAATMFYDCRNSRPQNIEFAVDDIVYFGKLKYSVQVVEPLYDGTKLHHYELGLIKRA